MAGRYIHHIDPVIVDVAGVHLWSDVAVLRRFHSQKLGADMDRQREIMATSAHQEGNPDAVTARDRIRFKPGALVVRFNAPVDPLNVRALANSFGLTAKMR